MLRELREGRALKHRALGRGDFDAAERRLAAVLADYRVRGNAVFLRSRPELASKLANFALAHGIETDYVKLLIERNELRAPANASAAIERRPRGSRFAARP